MNGNKIFMTVLLAAGFALSGCMGASNAPQAEGQDGKPPDQNSSPSHPPTIELNEPAANGTKGANTPEGPGEGSPSQSARLLELEISVEGSNLHREVDGYTASTGDFTFKAVAVPDGLAVDVNWSLDGEAESGFEVHKSFDKPGDYPIRVTATDADGEVISQESILRIPSRETHWLIRTIDARPPQDMLAVILPPAYFSSGPMLGNTSWLGPDASCLHPAVQAAIEALEYWQWFLENGSEEFPQLSGMSWTIKTVGCDAGPSDIQSADVVIAIAMADESLPVSQSVGVSQPWWPVAACFPSVVGFGARDEPPNGVRNVVLHEFGHCLGVDHSGNHTSELCSATYGCFDNHPDDVMSGGPPSERTCLSNLNLFAMAETWDWRSPIRDPDWYDGEVFMLKKDEYQKICMPESMNRF